MQSNENRVIVAAAGAGKTTQLVREALEGRDRRIAMVTYTHFNARQIAQRFAEMNSGIPGHVDLMTWFAFLLRECARPYQRTKYGGRRIESIYFVQSRSALRIPEWNVEKHYFAQGEYIYSDKIAKFAVECETRSSQAVTRRLSEIYTDIFIDEFQDLAGWDLDLIEMFLRSGVRVTLVGDPRQYTYSTNPGSKNQPYRGLGVMTLLQKWRDEGLCSLQQMSTSRRCHESICQFANRLWPEMEPMTSLREGQSEHEGVFLVGEALVPQYIERFHPQVLRHDRRSTAYGADALNFGAAKGLEFERVLIVPTEPIRKYLRTGSLHEIERSREKLYVAVTRASSSVAFVYDGASAVVADRWEP